MAAIVGVTAADQTALGAAGCTVLPLQAGTFNRASPFTVATLNSSATQAVGNLFNGNEYSVRVDWNATNNDRVFGQWNWTKQTDKFGPALNGARNMFSPFE